MTLLEQCKENTNKYNTDLLNATEEVFNQLVLVINEKILECSKTNSNFSFYLSYSSTSRHLVELDYKTLYYSLVFSKRCNDEILLEKLD